MNPILARTLEGDRSLKEIHGSTSSFATILRRNMQVDAWRNLHGNIHTRFASAADTASPLFFTGTMQWVYCSPIGALLAWMLKSLSILPGVNAQFVAFDFTIQSAGKGFSKLRRYQLPQQDIFSFSSHFSDEGGLHEEFAGGLGMYLQLSEERQALIFSDKGYYVRIGPWKLPLPRLFSVGAFELLHTNIAAEKFQVLIHISHPLLGTLFYQRGEFSGGKAGRDRERLCQEMPGRNRICE